MGRPCFNADPHRSTVRQLAEKGLSRDKIAAELGVTRKTLAKHFATELARPGVAKS